MLVYTIATLLTLLICYLTYPKEKDGELDESKIRKRKIISCALSMLPLLLVMSVRWNVGVDTWFTYTPEYLAMKSESQQLTLEEERILQASAKLKARLTEGTINEELDDFSVDTILKDYRYSYHHTGILFQWLQRGLLLLNADVQWLYVATSLIILCFVFASIWLQSARPFLACLFFVISGNFFLSMNIVSQYIAVAVCLLAYHYAEKRRPVPFFLLVAIAAGFHISAFVFIPVYFLPRAKIKPLWCILTIAASLVIAQFCFPILKKLIEWIAPAYVRHFTKGSDFEWVFFAVGCAVLAVGTYYYSKGKDTPYFRLWYYANALGLIALSFSGSIPLMKRISYYFAVSNILFLPLVMSLEKSIFRRRALHIITVALFILQIIVAIGMMNKHGTLPYKAFFYDDRLKLMQSMIDHIPGLW